MTPSSASLAWTQSTNGFAAEGYRIYRGPAQAADTDLTLIATIDPATEYSATNLRSGVAYKFGVAAIDLTNTQGQMRTATVNIPPSTDSAPPSPPSDASVHLTPFSSNRIDIVWGASTSTDISYYEVRRDDLLVGTIERPNWQRFSDNGLAPSSTHTYTVTAVDSAGNSAHRRRGQDGNHSGRRGGDHRPWTLRVERDRHVGHRFMVDRTVPSRGERRGRRHRARRSQRAGTSITP